MSKLKGLLIGVASTAVAIVIIFALVKRFAPVGIKKYFTVA